MISTCASSLSQPSVYPPQHAFRRSFQVDRYLQRLEILFPEPRCRQERSVDLSRYAQVEHGQATPQQLHIFPKDVLIADRFTRSVEELPAFLKPAALLVPRNPATRSPRERRPSLNSVPPAESRTFAISQGHSPGADSSAQSVMHALDEPGSPLPSGASPTSVPLKRVPPSPQHRVNASRTVSRIAVLPTLLGPMNTVVSPRSRSRMPYGPEIPDFDSRQTHRTRHNPVSAPSPAPTVSCGLSSAERASSPSRCAFRRPRIVLRRPPWPRRVVTPARATTGCG